MSEKLREADYVSIAHKVMDLLAPIVNERLDRWYDEVPFMVKHAVREMTADELRSLIKEKVREVVISASVTVEPK